MRYPDGPLCAFVTCPGYFCTSLVLMGLVVVVAAMLYDESDPERPQQQTPDQAQIAMPAPVATPTPTPDGLERVGAMCTGSMEPAITCLDLMLSQPSPAADMVKVGSIIRVASCDRRFTHRVVEIRETGGQRYYRTQGDASAAHDNCWIPHRDVLGLVVEIQRNVRLQNSRLRDAVNVAEAEMLANPDNPVAIAAYHCWHRAAHAAGYPGHIPHEC